MIDALVPDTIDHINLLLMQGEMPVEQGGLVSIDDILAHVAVRIRACRTIQSKRTRALKGWHLPALEGQVAVAGFASWVRVVLPGGVLVDCPLADFGMVQCVVAPGMWWSLRDVTVRYPPTPIIRLEAKQ